VTQTFLSEVLVSIQVRDFFCGFQCACVNFQKVSFKGGVIGSVRGSTILFGKCFGIAPTDSQKGENLEVAEIISELAKSDERCGL